MDQMMNRMERIRLFVLSVGFWIVHGILRFGHVMSWNSGISRDLPRLCTAEIPRKIGLKK